MLCHGGTIRSILRVSCHLVYLQLEQVLAPYSWKLYSLTMLYLPKPFLCTGVDELLPRFYTPPVVSLYLTGPNITVNISSCMCQ